MLTSPITITIDGVAHNLSLINQDNFGSVYLKKGTNLEIRLNIRHSYEKTSINGQFERHNVDLQHTVWDVDGKPTTTQSYMVMRSRRGSDGIVAANVEKGLNAFLDTNIAAIIAWES